jgi:hypothetical protein
MPNLRVSIVRFVDETQPGVVECEFTDANDRVHRLIDKVPIFSEHALWIDSQYPQPGDARCQILEEFRDQSGRELVHVTIARPDSLETTDGETEFVVLSSQVMPDPV